MAAEDCKPNKSLRTTIKVFLRTEEKKREALRLKEGKNTPPDTPLSVQPTPAESVVPAEERTNAHTNDITTVTEINDEKPRILEETPEVAPASASDPERLTQAQQDIPQPSIEVGADKLCAYHQLTIA